MKEKHSMYANLIRLVVVTFIGFQLCPASAQKNEAGVSPRPWVNKPSPATAASLQHWRLKFEPGHAVDAPEKGDFSVNMRGNDGTARLVSEFSTPTKLTPVIGRTRYVPKWEQRTDLHDKVVTKEMIELLRSPEITRFLATEHVDDPQLNIEKNFAVALVQEFDIALRTPAKKEHIWSINWRVANEWIATKSDSNEWTTKINDSNPVGYSVWGLFTKVNGVMKPFHLAATRDETIGASPYYYVLAIGDLDGNGIDELIVNRIEFEAEESLLELWAWEHGGPVVIQKLP
jgi:hypothetical protein